MIFHEFFDDVLSECGGNELRTNVSRQIRTVRGAISSLSARWLLKKEAHEVALILISTEWVTMRSTYTVSWTSNTASIYILNHIKKITFERELPAAIPCVL